MSNQFSDLIDLIEREIGTYYQSGAIRWIDENHNGAWSAAIDRFDRVLVTSDIGRAQAEARIYKAAVGAFLRLYKEQRVQKKAANFFEDLKLKQRAVP